jgi:hypothetical protein
LRSALQIKLEAISNPLAIGLGFDAMLEWRRLMKTALFPSVLMIVAMLATPVAAQVRSITTAPRLTVVPPTMPHIANTGTSLSAPATSPLQQQMQQDYATQLRAAQQQLMMRNPSGLTRPEESISRQLNGYTPQ